MAISKKITVLAGLVAFNAVMLALTVVLAADVTWSYSGDEGPANWGALSPDYALCADGSAQSPIDITDASEIALVDIAFDYGETANTIFNNGHTIQVNVDSGSHIVYNGIKYELLQFHFHAPSEHTIAGEAAPMEIHFVHQDPNSGNLAVAGILLNEGESENAAYAGVIDNLPAQAGEPTAMGDAIALDAMLPERLGYYTYQGSLTTPPCSEIVRWLLLDAPVALSADQIAAYTAIYAGNARPTLPRGQRDLLHTTRGEA